MAKEIVGGKEAKERLLAGVNVASKVVKVVASTLGPSGHNVLIGKKFKKPWITNDGVSIANEIDLEDPVADLGARTLLEVAMQTNERAGDGTTTSTILAHALITKGFNPAMFLQDDPMVLYRKIKTDSEVVFEELKKKAKPIASQAEVIKVATSSMEDTKVGKLIADLVEKTGVDGFISVEGHNEPETTSEVEEGLQYNRMGVGSIHHLDANGECKLQKPSVIVTNQEMIDPNVLTNLAIIMKADNLASMVIISPKFSEDVLADFYYAKKAGANIVPIKGGILTNGEMQDIATYCEGVFIDNKVGITLENMKASDIGKCEKIIATRRHVALMGGNGDMTAQIKDVKDEIKEERHEAVKKKLQQRLASISGGVGIIHVGGDTDTEREYLKLKIEDAINATKAAIEEGVVRGGGIALKEIADGLPDDNFLKDCITKPYEKIQENAGGSLEIGEDILDPVKVTRTALENAVSAARTFLTTDFVIVEDTNTAAQELVKVLTQVK